MNKRYSTLLYGFSGLGLGVVAIGWQLPLLAFAFIVPTAVNGLNRQSLAMAVGAGIVIDGASLVHFPAATCVLVIISQTSYYIAVRYLNRHEFITVVFILIGIALAYFGIHYGIERQFMLESDVWHLATNITLAIAVFVFGRRPMIAIS